ncbi:zinc metalloprotease [Gammaproteobacteria bacterium]|nr:zinc metalloprotease [Gammaproteobacteria bacterium]
MPYKSLLLLLIALALPAVASSRETVRQSVDGSVQLGERWFSSYRTLTESQQFRDAGLRCGVDTLAQERAAERGFAAQPQLRNPSDCSKTLTRIMSEYYPNGVTYEIPIWFHVITNANGTGNVSDARINAQIQVLNEDFGAIASTLGANGYPTGLQFTLVGITRSSNTTWFNDATSQAEFSYKNALNRDPSRYLNIYSTQAGGYLGYAYFPQDAAGQVYDGVVLRHESVGGRNNGFSSYDQGRTAVHEIGHWLGLFHTFAGGSACANSYSSGDLIVDTAAESSPKYGCGARTTCGTPDDVDNYMNYSDDSCMDRFSAQQTNRMACSLLNYRPTVFTTGDDDFLPIILPLLLSNDSQS